MPNSILNLELIDKSFFSIVTFAIIIVAFIIISWGFKFMFLHT